MVECIHCTRKHASFGLLPLCRQCTRKHAAALKPAREPAQDERGCYGIEQLRQMVNLFNGCNESFNMQFGPTELVRLYQAYHRSEWDIAPDRWTLKEIRDALAGHGNGAKGDR